MSRYYLNVVFLCSGTIGQPQGLETLLDAIQQSNYKVEVLKVGNILTEQFAFWRHYDDLARREMGIAYEKQHLSFGPTEKVVSGGGIILTFDVRWLTDEGGPADVPGWPWRLWQVEGSGCNSIVEAHTDDTAMFTQKQWNPEDNASRLLELAKVIYNTIRPRFAWVERCHWKGYTTPEDVVQLRLPHLYWANFFSPSYVEKLGQEFLMNAPGWKKESLPDGGLLYVLSPSLAGTGPKATVTAVQNYFGVPSVRRRAKLSSPDIN